MVIVYNKHFVAEGEPGNLGGRGRDEKGEDAYEAAWKVWMIYGIEETPDGDRILVDDLFATGFVKWDECSNWSFKNDTYMHHACTREALVSVGDILAKCFDASASLMPRTWNGNKPSVIQLDEKPPIIVGKDD